MPKRVDHAQRRAEIADALLRVTSRDGLESVSLRTVAAEAGVTAGMVQHYFPSKHAMLDHAMSVSRGRYEARMYAALARYGDRPTLRQFVGGMTRAMLPADEDGRADARVALAFQAYAAAHPDVAAGLADEHVQMRGFLAAMVAAEAPQHDDPDAIATALIGVIEGLGAVMMSAAMPVDDAVRAVDRLVGLVLGTEDETPH